MFDAETQQALIQEFLSENREAMDRVERDLLLLESNPTHHEWLNSVFRDMHTVKGNCRMMEFTRLEELTHTAESLLHLLREGKLLLRPAISNQLLAVLDAVRRSLLCIEQTGSEGEEDFTAQILQMEQCHEEVERLGETGLELLLETHSASDAPPESAAPAGEKEARSNRLDSVRISIERLDTLMNQIGEMGATFNQLKYAIAHHPQQIDHSLEGLEQHLQKLQGEVLQYRLQPIGQILESYHRLVRDLAVETGKKVLLELTGEETEVDRSILISIKEVLGHVIRNAIDHGIESSAVRLELGKSAVGHLRIAAEQKHGQVYLDIADDGKGIDLNKVRAKALAKNLISMEQALEMKEPEIMRLIMAPGFSTAEQVSKISGRGTGLDVVQTAIDKLGGSITISSEPGLGTRFRLRIPQTMAIVPVLLVRALQEGYAIPQVNIVELLSFYGDEVAGNIEGKMRSPMVRVREQLLPLVSLRQALATPIAGESPAPELKQLQARAELHVVVLHAEEALFGLEVDAIQEPANLVIKPMGQMLSHIAILAGTAVMPDGSVSFLLNVPELIKC
ncbi:MAG: chemotaxis protein CheA [Magnetococcus sp. YQC-3]